MLALLFDHYGPYHRARLQGALRLMPCTGIEFFKSSQDYGWDVAGLNGLPIMTVADDAVRGKSKHPEFTRKLIEVLDTIQPSVVAVPGWSSKPALAALQWCLAHKVPAVLMSESSKIDFTRNAMKEWVKRRLVRLFSAGLVGGTAHKEYLHELGMPPHKIHLGYDAVDNDYFESQAKNHSTETKVPVFLASARFIEKKNLISLLKAYAVYRIEVARYSAPWDFILLGGGLLKEQIEAEISLLGLSNYVQLPGFKQYGELPAYYACAGAFIHASTTEQWGLVVNEAMASGLPVLVSRNCGCARDLVQEGGNGFTFDPYDLKTMSDAMLCISMLSEQDRSRMGQASVDIISQWSPERFGQGLSNAADMALSFKPCRVSTLDRCLLNLLSRS